ncbi:flap endonuclease-1 [Nanoarchaeota archaeon]
MGVKLKDILVKKEITFESLRGKILVVDAMNMLYQFLASIRQYDGSLLTDSKGNVTSHLSGLFHRTSKLMQKGMKISFVFDGKAPDLKKKERERRRRLKEDAKEEYEVAKQREDFEGMKKYAARTTVMTPEMIEDAKKLIKAMGMPIVQAPSEGEAQAAQIVKNGHAYAEISQDQDCLLFGVERMIQNLTLTQRQKKQSKLAYETIKPQLVSLSENLNNLSIDHTQLIALGMLVGTDFNIGGIKGVGPVNALKLVKKHGADLDALFKEVKWDDHFDFPWTEVYYTITKMPVTNDYDLVWKPMNNDRVKEILCSEHDFSTTRIEDSIENIEKEKSKNSQKGLGEFF